MSVVSYNLEFYHDHDDDFIKMINDNKNHKLILYDLLDSLDMYPWSVNYTPSSNIWFYKIFSKIDPKIYKNIYFLSCDINLRKTYDKIKESSILKRLISEDIDDINLRFYPWLFVETMFGSDRHFSSNKIKQIKPKYNVSYLSLARKLNRIMIIGDLHEYDTFVYSNLGIESDSANFLIQNVEPYRRDFYTVSYTDLEEHSSIFKMHMNPDDIISDFSYRKKNFDSNITKKLNENKELFLHDYEKKDIEFQYFCPMEYFESIINLASETYTLYSTHITEKTIKNFLHKKPYLMLAGPNYYSFLDDEGFLLYDEIFDYSFDKLSFHDRYNSIINQIKKILDISTDDLYHAVNTNIINEKLEHNYNLCFSKFKGIDDILTRIGGNVYITKYFEDCIINNDERFFPK